MQYGSIITLLVETFGRETFANFANGDLVCKSLSRKIFSKMTIREILSKFTISLFENPPLL